MKLTNDEQTKRSLIKTQKRVLELEERVERLEGLIFVLINDVFLTKEEKRDLADA